MPHSYSLSENTITDGCINFIILASNVLLTPTLKVSKYSVLGPTLFSGKNKIPLREFPDANN